MSDKNTELRMQFEAQASDPSFKFARSRKGTYVNPALARDWKWFQAGAAHPTTEAAAMAAMVPAEMSQPNRLIAYLAAEKLRAIGHEWDDTAKAWVQAPVAGQPAEPSHIHRKSGGRYTLLGQGRLQCDTPLADMAEIAIYRGEDGRLWARDAVEFAGRFDRAAPKGDSNG